MAAPASATAAVPAVHVNGSQHAGAVDQAYDLAGLPDAAGSSLPVLLDAYQVAALAAPTTCHLDVSLLAAIGQVESDNLDGRSIDADQVVQPAVVGRALDGRRVARVRDTDAGLLDKDFKWDRGIGPMKLLPSAWKVAAVDLGGDGKRDPQNVYDSVGAAMVHLCAEGADLATSDGLRESLLRFKPSHAWRSLVLAWKGLFERSGVDTYWGLMNWAVSPTELMAVPAALTGTDPAPGPKNTDVETINEARPVMAAPVPTPKPVATVTSPSPHPAAPAPGSPEPSASAGSTPEPTPASPSPLPSPGHPTSSPSPPAPSPEPTPSPEPPTCPAAPEGYEIPTSWEPGSGPNAPAPPRPADGPGPVEEWEPGHSVPSGCPTPQPTPPAPTPAPAP